MNYKKIVSLFAVSTLALSACGTTDEADDTVDTTETEDTASSSDDLIDRALENTGDAFNGNFWNTEIWSRNILL